MQDFDEYQTQAARTAVYPRRSGLQSVMYCALGLNGEAGEVADVIKKSFRRGDSSLTVRDRAAVAAELGDVLWYVAAVASSVGISLGSIAEGNLHKLKARQEQGALKDR